MPSRLLPRLALLTLAAPLIGHAQTMPTIDIHASKSGLDASLASGTPAVSIDIPSSISQVTMATLTEQGGTSLQDALRNVPGAQADLSFTGSHAQTFVLRGFLADSGTGSSRVLRDGARLSNYPFVAAFLDSVEVLRGPGAVIGTRGEPGGTVQLLTKQAKMNDFGAFSAAIGQYGARETALDINRVLSAEQQLAARLVVNHSESSEWRGVPDRLDGVKLALAKGGGERYHLRAGIEMTNQRYRPDYGVPALNGRPAAIPFDRQLGEPWADSTTRNTIVDLHLDAALYDTLRWAVDATHLDGASTSVRQSVSAKLPGAPGLFSRVIAVEPDTRRRIDSLATSLSQTIEHGAFTHNLYLGAEYYRETLAQPGGSVTAPASPNIDIFNPGFGQMPGLVLQPAAIKTTLTREDLHSATATLQDRVDWRDWSVLAGVSYLRQHFFYGVTGTPVDEGRYSPKFALLKHWSPRQTLYASYASGTAPNQAASASGQSLPSRRSAQYELGWKSDWPDQRLQTSAALFWLDQSNMLADDASTVYMYDKILSGEARAKGLELSADGQLAPRLAVTAAYAYTDSRFLRHSEFAGKHLPNVAAQTLSVFVHHDLTGDGDDLWRAGLGLYSQGRRYADQLNSTVLPGYARFDATLAYRRKPQSQNASQRTVEWRLSVRNLFDKEYYAASHLHVSRYILPGESRAATVSAVYRF